MLVVTSISVIFSQKKKRQSAIKFFAGKQFPRVWEAKVKKNPKNLRHLNKSNYLACPNSLPQHMYTQAHLFFFSSPRLSLSLSLSLLPSSLTIAPSHCQSLPFTCCSPSYYYCSEIHSLGISGK